MKTYLKTTAIAAAMAAVFAGPALADVQVIGTFDKDKDVKITVDTDKNITVNTRVRNNGVTTGSAQAMGAINATIVDSEVGTNNEVIDMDINKSASIDDSVNQNAGIVQFNQDTGNISNQGNTAALAVVFSDDEEKSQSTISEAYADQRIARNFSSHTEDASNLGDLPEANGANDLSARIQGSILGNVGVVHVNQNAGNMNNQHNMLTAAVGTSAVVALSDAGLGQEISNNGLFDVNTIKRNEIAGSVNGNTGIVNVNQSAGHMNNQSTVISVSALASSVGL